MRGDPAYAPPELLYGHVDPDWRVRCQACDWYLLGSLILFVFTRTQTTAEIMRRLPSALRPPKYRGAFGGTYADALPYVVNAFDDVSDSFRVQLSGQKTAELVDHFRSLCHPDVGQRGDAIQRRRGHNPFDLRRLISRLDVLTREAQGGFLGRVSK